MTRDLLELAREVVRGEAAAVAALETRLGESFVRAVGTLAGCRGKVVVSGVGKSGLLANKLAATLTSTGTPAVFLHPADALHGDAGLFAPGDVALFLSKSGASDELLALLPYLERHGIPLVSIVATPGSALERKSEACVVTGPVREVCPLELAPTTSVTVAQVVGDCLAVALLERRGFQADDFRFLHPGGVIGVSRRRRALPNSTRRPFPAVCDLRAVDALRVDRRPRDDLDSAFGQRGPHLLGRQHLAKLRVERRDRGVREACRREHGLPQAEVESRNERLGDRRKPVESRQTGPGPRGHGQRAHRTVSPDRGIRRRPPRPL